jgi:hypothetical protein
MIMKFFSVMLCVLVALGVIVVSSGTATAGAAVNAADVAEHMDKTKYSSDDVKGYLRALKGKQIVAEGKVDDVITGKTGAKIVLSVDVPGRSRNFVVDVRVKEAGKFHKGDRASCEGRYAKYNMFTLNGIGINGHCSKQ